MSEPVLSGVGLSKFYMQADTRIDALRDADVSLVRGEILTVLGPSGSGKTTLLNCLVGWEQLDKGEVRWHGEVCEPRRLGWGELAIVPQSIGLLEELTVAENVALPGRVGGVSVSDDRVSTLLDALGLTALADRLPAETSLGEQQRAGLARALVLDPDVLIADEPTGHQDSGWAKRILEVLRAAASDGTACLLATHHRATVEFADRALVIRDGTIGSADDLEHVLPRDEL